MKSTKHVLRQSNNGKSNDDYQAASNSQQSNNDQTMSLVYPDGRVTNVKVRQKKS